MKRTLLNLSALLAAASLMMLSAPMALAQTSTNTQSNVGLGIKGLGASLGFVDPEGGSSTLSLGLHVDAGTLVQNLHVVPYFQYWSVGATVGAYETDRSDVAFAMDLNYDFPIQGSRVTPYLGSGLGLHFLSADATAPGATSSSDTKLGIDLQGGIRSPMMPNFSLYAQTRYAFISDAGQFSIEGGFTYLFVY